MKCPRCSCSDSKVVDSRLSRDTDGIRRRRQCSDCGNRFSTMEQVVPAELVVIKRDEGREEFNPLKIRVGIQKACWKRPVSEDAVDGLLQRITAEIDDLGEREVSSDQIGEIVMDEMRQIDQVAYVRFASVYRQFEDAEEFINEIRKLGKGRRRTKIKVKAKQ